LHKIDLIITHTPFIFSVSSGSYRSMIWKAHLQSKNGKRISFRRGSLWFYTREKPCRLHSLHLKKSIFLEYTHMHKVKPKEQAAALKKTS